MAHSSYLQPYAPLGVAARNSLVTLAVAATVALSYVCAGYLRQWRHPPQPAEFMAVETAPDFNSFSGCIYRAALTYQVPLGVLKGILYVEGGRIGQAVPNANGTYDLGPMQINTIWVTRLAHMWHVDYATAYRTIRDNGCENIYIGAWILKQKVAQTGTLYNGIAYYHSATPIFGVPYVNKVMRTMQDRNLFDNWAR